MKNSILYLSLKILCYVFPIFFILITYLKNIIVSRLKEIERPEIKYEIRFLLFCLIFNVSVINIIYTADLEYFLFNNILKLIFWFYLVQIIGAIIYLAIHTLYLKIRDIYYIQKIKKAFKKVPFSFLLYTYKDQNIPYIFYTIEGKYMNEELINLEMSNYAKKLSKRSNFIILKKESKIIISSEFLLKAYNKEY